MINGRPSREPTSDERSAALEREHAERMNRTRQVRLEYIKVRETAASVRETWHRLLDEREGTGDHELRRAALNILEDAERAEAGQRASEALYRTLFESIDEAFCIIEVLFDHNELPVDYRFIEANPAFQRHTGLANAIGRTMRELVPNHEEHWFETYGRIALTGQAERFECRAAALGRDFDIYAFRTGAPHERKVALLFTDITERKRQEANLIFLAEVSQDLVRLTNADETMNTLGGKVGAHFGLSLCAFIEIDETAETGTITHSWHRADVPQVSGVYRIADFIAPEFQRASRAGETVVVRDTSTDPLTKPAEFAALKIGSFVTVPLLREGEWRFCLGVYRSEPHEWRKDEVELIREITTRVWTRLERARAEEVLARSREELEAAFLEMRRAREEAEAASHTKDRFLAILSHELRTPLTPVLGAAESILRQKNLSPRTVEGLQMICRNVELQARLINDLLDLTRISRGTLELNRQAVNLHEVLKASVEISLPDIEARQQKLTVELNAKHPTVNADVTRTQQVFWNLLKNASKFTPEGGEIRITSRDEPGWIVVEISDTGIGIDPKALAHIFDAFRQADVSIAQRFGGLGLGLAISKATLDAHGGSIEAHSAGTGHGTTFTVKYPLEER